MVGRQPNAPTAFTPGEIPGTHFQRLSRPQGTWFCRRYHEKKSPVTPPGIDPGTILLVAQCLNHYSTPGPIYCNVMLVYLVVEMMLQLFSGQTYLEVNVIQIYPPRQQTEMTCMLLLYVRSVHRHLLPLTYDSFLHSVPPKKIIK